MDLPLIHDNEDKSSILKNCIRKKYKHLRKWALRSETNAFRIYDRDIKAYPLAIEFYAGKFSVQYFSFDRDQDEPSLNLKNEVEKVLQDLFLVSNKEIYWRSRFRRKKEEQYEKRGSEKDFFVCQEYGVKFWINLTDYLDTGLFLDHRETRQIVSKLCTGKRFLNLFSYTASFSVHAAMKGASFTKSVDLSNTYTNWGRENFDLNGLEKGKNPIVREDCFKFLKEETALYDVIMIDPPTMSRSKKMEGMLDIQKDHVWILRSALKRLAKGGILFFSTNFRRFELDEKALFDLDIHEISHKTVPEEFHQRKIHRSWKMTSKES